VAVITITITPVNDAPVAVDDTATTVQGQAVTIDVLANDSDPDGDPLTVAVPNSWDPGYPANGQVVANADGTITYTPNPGWFGAEVFTYYATDDSGAQTPGMVTVTVLENRSPVAVEDRATIDEDSSTTIDVRANDSDPDGDPLTVLSITQPSNGMAVLNPDQTVTYTPDPDWNGTDRFTYLLSDGRGGTATGTVTITVLPVNDAPIATPGAFTVAEGSAHTGAVTGTDVDGDALTFAVVTGPVRGTLALNPDGSFTYTAARQPTVGFVGSDRFTFRAFDGTDGSDPSEITITITPINDAPIATPGAFTMAEGATHTGAVTGTDADGDALTFEVVTTPQRGTLVFNTDGTFTYIAARQPTAGFVGTDSFTFRASDESDWSDESEIAITITPINDAPIATPGAFTVTEGATHTGAVTGTDGDGDELTFEVVTGPVRGTLALNPDGTFTYTAARQPTVGFVGTDRFTFRAFDGADGSDPSEISITITPVNDAPIATPGSFTVEEGATHTGAVGGTDADGDALTVEVVTGPVLGALVLNPDGSFTYIAARQPTVGFAGTDSFTFRASDASDWSDVAEITITITPVNDAPQIIPVMEPERGRVGTPFVLAVHAVDPDGDAVTFALSAGPEWMRMDPQTGIIHGLPMEEDVGAHEVTVEVWDTLGDTVTHTFTVIVEPRPRTAIRRPSGEPVPPRAWGYFIRAHHVDTGKFLFSGMERGVRPIPASDFLLPLALSDSRSLAGRDPGKLGVGPMLDPADAPWRGIDARHVDAWIVGVGEDGIPGTYDDLQATSVRVYIDRSTGRMMSMDLPATLPPGRYQVMVSFQTETDEPVVLILLNVELGTFQSPVLLMEDRLSE